MVATSSRNMARTTWLPLALLAVLSLFSACDGSGNAVTAKDTETCYVTAIQKFLFLILWILQAHLQEAVKASERLSYVVVTNQVSPGNLNVVVDKALPFIRQWILQNGKDSSPLPDVDESMWHGYLKATGGFFQHLSTLQRASDVTVSGPNTNATIVGDFSLADLNFGFAQYKARYFFAHAQGTIKGWVGQNRARVGVRLSVGPPGVCAITLDAFKIVQLDGISLHLTGPFASELSKVATKIANQSKGKVIAMAEQRGAEELTAAFATLDCPRTVCRLLQAADKLPDGCQV